MKWNKYPENPLPEYEVMLFIYEDERYITKAEDYKMIRVWAEGYYFPKDGLIRLTGGGCLRRNKVLYWGRVELPQEDK